MPLTTMHRAYSMFHIHPVISLAPFYRPEVGSENQDVAPLRAEYIGFRLCPRNLFCEYKLPTSIICSRLIEKYNQLHRKVNIAVQIPGVAY